jgi:hypothetical protein
MKNKHYFITLIFTAFIFASCANRQSETTKTAEPVVINEIPQSLQKESKISYLGSRGVDLLEDLYQDLVEKDAKLQALDKEVNVVGEQKTKEGSATWNDFAKYNQHLLDYYAAANNHIAGIQDSVLRKKIIEIIGNSTKNYEQKTAEHSTLIADMNKNKQKISDQYNVMKILLTLKMMEKYQSENLPSTKGFKTEIESQKALIEKIEVASGKTN